MLDGTGTVMWQAFSRGTVPWVPEDFSTFRADGYMVLACVACGDGECGTTLWIMDDAHPMSEQLTRMLDHAAVCTREVTS